MPTTDSLDDTRLLGGFPTIRRVTARESPWPGRLLRTPGGATTLAVDAAALPPSWVGWTADPDGHLLGAIDVLRTTTGQAALLEPCTERLSDFLARRESTLTPLTAGEVITLAVSALRARGELASRSAESGEWWLTDAGRPVLAVGVGATAAVSATRDLLLAAARSSDQHLPLLDTAAVAVSAERITTHELEEIETALFAAARPSPLQTAMESSTAATPRRVARSRAADTAAPGAHSPLRALMSHVDADLADAVSRVTTAIWRRSRAPGPPGASRRRLVVVAGAIAALVVGVGLLWPSGVDESETTAPTGGPSAYSSPAASASAAARPTSSPSPASATSESRVDDLLRARSACQADTACLSDVQEDPGAVFDAGPIDAAAADRTITMLDDFGGAAVVRVDADGGSQLVVIVQRAEQWLLRDVHDVAEQP